MADDQGFTYKQAGVDVEAGNRAVDLMKQRLKSTKHPLVLGGLGGFGGALRLPKLKDPVLVAGTDGVGTKIELARTMGKLGTIGIDLVAMSVNDVSACGAVPLFFLDYLVVGKVVPEEVAEIVAGVDEGCQLAQCVLLGGETAEHPGQFPDGDFDMAGFAVGLAERDELWGPHLVADGDVLVGICSSGLHSNGFSLVRHLLREHAIDVHSKFLSEGGAFCVHAGPKVSVGEVLLAPTIIYSLVLHDLGHAGGVHAAGVPQIVQHEAVDDGGRQQDLADRDLGAGVHAEGAALAEELAVHVDGVLPKQVAHQAEDVGMQAAGADADEDVAVRDEVRSPQLVALREADGEAGHVEIAVRELPGVLGGLAAEQHALRQLTALVHAGDDLGDLLGHDLADHQIVEAEERDGAAGRHVVDAHGHQVDADGTELAHGPGELDLGAHAVGAGYQHRVFELRQSQRSAEAAEPAEHQRVLRALEPLLHEVDGAASRLDVDARLLVREPLVVGHRAPPSV